MLRVPRLGLRFAMIRPSPLKFNAQSCDPEDSDLLTRIRSGDPDALIILYKKYSARVFSLLCRILEDPLTAEEILQDTFHRLWLRSELFDPRKGLLISWLFTVGRNLALDFKRKESRRTGINVSVEGAEDSDRLAEWMQEAAAAAFDEDDSEALRQAMNELPEEQRTVIELAYWEGLTQEELAVRLGEPLGTIKTRVRLAFKKLRQKLSSDWRLYSR